MENIKVALRIRPLNKNELINNEENKWITENGQSI